MRVYFNKETKSFGMLALPAPISTPASMPVGKMSIKPTKLGVGLATGAVGALAGRALARSRAKKSLVNQGIDPNSAQGRASIKSAGRKGMAVGAGVGAGAGLASRKFI